MYTTKNNIKNFGKLTALASFTYGTLLLIGFILFKDYYKEDIIIVGLSYIGIAALINTLMFIVLLISALYFWKNKREFILTCGFLMLNIPIVIIYFFIVLYTIGF